jgi:hypothetical protein
MLAFILRGLQGCLTGKLPAKRRFDRREFGSKRCFVRKLRVQLRSKFLEFGF